MLRMYGGPADCQEFDCSRAPRLLRLVQAQSGRWDCLDQLEDEPRPTETIHIYEQFRSHAGAFICPGGYSADGCYEPVLSVRLRSPLDRIVRSRGGWRRFSANYFGITVDEWTGERIAGVTPIHVHGG